MIGATASTATRRPAANGVTDAPRRNVAPTDVERGSTDETDATNDIEVYENHG